MAGRLVALLLAMACVALPVRAQPAPAASAASSAPAPALRLFALEIRSGPAWNTALPPGQQPLMREHSAYLRKLREEGRIRTGARYGEVGLIVIEAATLEEARAWVDADPAMRGGLFRYELHPLTVIYPGSLAR